MRKKVGELLVQAGVVKPDDVRMALGKQRTLGAGVKLAEVLLAMGVVSHEQVAEVLAVQSGLPYVELGEIPRPVLNRVPRELQLKHRLVPFRIEQEGTRERFCVAVMDPADLGAIDDLSFKLGKPIKAFVASAARIEEVLASLRGDRKAAVAPLEIGSEGGELQVERDAASLVPDGWFVKTPSQAAPPAESASLELDELLGGLLPASPPVGGGTPLPPRTSLAKAEPQKLAAALARLLIRKGLIAEAELTEELGRK